MIHISNISETLDDVFFFSIIPLKSSDENHRVCLKQTALTITYTPNIKGQAQAGNNQYYIHGSKGAVTVKTSECVKRGLPHACKLILLHGIIV